MAKEYKCLDFGLKPEEWDAAADEFAEIIACVIKNPAQIQDYWEPIPRGDKTKRVKLTSHRFRIDPHCLGYTLTVLPADKRTRRKVCTLIAKKLRKHLKEKYVCVKYDYTMPRVINHFLIYA